jgi:hypothetical protein
MLDDRTVQNTLKYCSIERLVKVANVPLTPARLVGWQRQAEDIPNTCGGPRQVNTTGYVGVDTPANKTMTISLRIG